MTASKIVAAAASGVGGAGLDVDEVFSTFLYDGTGSAQTITNGIDLDGEGGLVWTKSRSMSSAGYHQLIDTVRGVGKFLSSDLTQQEYTDTQTISAFNSTGYAIGNDAQVNTNNETFTSWTFRKAPKFFDVVTYTGNSTSGRQIAHNLGAVPGMMIIKKTSGSGGWRTYHRGANGGTNPENYYADLNDTAAFSSLASVWNQTAPTATHFTLGDQIHVNQNGETFVAYIFAHNNSDGGFGPDSDADIIKCGSYTGNGSTTGPVVNLGFEPQFLMIKNASTSSDWTILDTMRGLDYDVNYDPFIRPNLSNAEAAAFDCANPLATGFQLKATSVMFNTNNDTFIYMAIRRGSLAAPDDATKVFDVEIGGSSVADDALATTTGFPVDMFMHFDNYSSGGEAFVVDRMRGRSAQVRTQHSNAEGTYSTNNPSLDSNSGLINRSGSTQNLSGGIYWQWRRARGYFDVVAYTGTGSNRTVSHNLDVEPEIVIVKQRSSGNEFFWYVKSLGNTKKLELPGTAAAADAAVGGNQLWNSTTPTSSVFSVSDNPRVNDSGETYIAYLFATAAGVSKVGSYTGNGGTQNIDCGFSSGARFVLIKITSDSGDWRLYDTVRGIVAGDDAQLVLNNNNAQITSGYDFIDPHSSGFALPASPYTNNSGETYIFYAIA